MKTEIKMTNWVIAKITGFSVIFLVCVIVLLSSFYTVEEGHVGIVKRWSKAVSQVGPGLHFKLPIAYTVSEIDIRTRKNVEELAAATTEQMPASATVSFNWTVVQEESINLYRKYGGLEQFADRILDPILRSASKSAIAKYSAEEIIQTRSIVIQSIEDNLLNRLGKYKSVVTFDSVQLENIDFPAQYMESIQEKQKQKNIADAESHKLRRQEVEVQQQVNTAKAQRDSAKAIAEGKAFAIQAEATAQAEAIRLKGLAEAEALREQALAIAESPILVDYIRAKGWNGQMPTTMMGSDSNVIWSINKEQ